MVNPIMPNKNPRVKRETLILVGVFVGVLLVSAFAVYFLAGKTTQPEATRDSPQSATEVTPGSEPVTRGTPPRMTDKMVPPSRRSLVPRLKTERLLGQ